MKSLKRREFIRTALVGSGAVILTHRFASEHGLGEIDPAKLKLLEL